MVQGRFEGVLMDRGVVYQFNSQFAIWTVASFSKSAILHCYEFSHRFKKVAMDKSVLYRLVPGPTLPPQISRVERRKTLSTQSPDVINDALSQ
jgi:hypothetical protein